MTMREGQVATLEYTVRFEDGTLVDSTGQCGPLSIMIGSGQLFPALENRVTAMESGETREFRIPPEDAYGAWHPALVRELPRDRLPPDLALEIGHEYRLRSPDGKQLRFRLVEIGDATVRADFNDPKAGKTLVAVVTVVAVRAATPEEERRGRV